MRSTLQLRIHFWYEQSSFRCSIVYWTIHHTSLPSSQQKNIYEIKLLLVSENVQAGNAFHLWLIQLNTHSFTLKDVPCNSMVSEQIRWMNVARLTATANKTKKKWTKPRLWSNKNKTKGSWYFFLVGNINRSFI